MVKLDIPWTCRSSDDQLDTKALNSTGFTEPISWTMPLQKKSVGSPGHDGFDDGFGAISPHDILFMTSSHINIYYYIILHYIIYIHVSYRVVI